LPLSNGGHDNLGSMTQNSKPLFPAALDGAIRVHLGQHLRDLYGDPAAAKLPRHLASLATRVKQVIQAHAEPVDQAFTDAVMRTLPSLRAFAITLTKSVDRAEDLVQDTVLKALGNRDRFEPGTNLEAWLFTILRNNHFSSHRKTSREVEDADGVHASSLVAVPEQEGKIELRELSAALSKLSPEHRDALILVGAEGMAYEEAAASLGVKVGTVKSRVNRARQRLAELMGLTPAVT
jgi:RNA polymerase sigma-70 factor (ECF subfamily)